MSYCENVAFNFIANLDISYETFVKILIFYKSGMFFSVVVFSGLCGNASVSFLVYTIT